MGNADATLEGIQIEATTNVHRLRTEFTD